MTSSLAWLIGPYLVAKQMEMAGHVTTLYISAGAFAMIFMLMLMLIFLGRYTYVIITSIQVKLILRKKREKYL